jgi:hypothetical protein
MFGEIGKEMVRLSDAVEVAFTRYSRNPTEANTAAYNLAAAAYAAYKAAIREAYYTVKEA